MSEDPGDGTSRIALRFLEDHPEEAACLLEGFAPGDAAPLLERCAPGAVARLLRCATPAFATGCLTALAPELAGAALEALPLGHAAALLRRMDEPDRGRLLEAAPERCAGALGRVLRHPDGTAGSLMNPSVLSLPADCSVAESVARLRRSSPDDLFYLYVVDREQKLVGVVTYRQLLMADADAALSAVMHQPVSSLSAFARGEALFGHPGWRLYLALPVVDEAGRLIGAVHRDALLGLERGGAGPGAARAGAAALGLAEVVWLGLSRTLGDLLGPGAEPADRRSPHGR